MTGKVLARPLPVLFACSCGTSAGRLAPRVAAALDRAGKAEAAAAAEVEAGMAQALTKARERFPVIALDGCERACARRGLERRGVTPFAHYLLSTFGIASREGGNFTPAEEKAALAAIAAGLG